MMQHGWARNLKQRTDFIGRFERTKAVVRRYQSCSLILFLLAYLPLGCTWVAFSQTTPSPTHQARRDHCPEETSARRCPMSSGLMSDRAASAPPSPEARSEEHTSELQ